jgi:hypothetical protein
MRVNYRATGRSRHLKVYSKGVVYRLDPGVGCVGNLICVRGPHSTYICIQTHADANDPHLQSFPSRCYLYPARLSFLCLSFPLVVVVVSSQPETIDSAYSGLPDLHPSLPPIHAYTQLAAHKSISLQHSMS